MARFYIIRPIRNVKKETKQFIDSYVDMLEEQGNKVYDPARDTDNSENEWEICRSNTVAIMDAERISVFYDKRSKGTHFDLGVAFALGKEIKVEEIIHEDSAVVKLLEKWEQEKPHPV